MGSVLGSILAGIVLGESQALFTAFVPDIRRALSYSNAFSMFVLVVLLIVRPTGIFGRRHLRME